MKLRDHLTYANVTATLALMLAIGGGGAYAVDKINSRDIVNGSIRSPDLRNHKAVRGVDVKRNGLTGKQIKERTLDVPGTAALSGNETIDCRLQSSVVRTNCALTGLELERPSRVLVIATGNQESVGGPASAECRVTVDGVQEPLAVLPGEERTSNTSGIATNGFARTFISNPLAPGVHRFALACKRFGGRAFIDSPTIAALAIGLR